MEYRRRSATQAVIFDLWGTLVPFQAAAAAQLVETMAEPLSVPADAFARVWAADFDRRATGDLEDSLRRVCRTLGAAPPDAAIAEALLRRISFHRACFTPRPDAAPTLGEFRTLGLKLGLITDCSSEVPELWASSPLAALVDAALFSCAERIKKPDRRIYELACSRLGVVTSACIYVGDGGSDELVGASAVGMRAIQLRTADTEPHPWQGESVSSFTELLQLVAAALRRRGGLR